MEFLLDTHTLIWYLDNNPSLSKNAREKIENSDAVCYTSIASLWEISIKISIGKLVLTHKFEQLEKFCRKSDILILPILFEHLRIAEKLEFNHKDPFDRLIISQAKAENLTIISKDENFKKYKEIEVLW